MVAGKQKCPIKHQWVQTSITLRSAETLKSEALKGEQQGLPEPMFSNRRQSGTRLDSVAWIDKFAVAIIYSCHTSLWLPKVL